MPIVVNWGDPGIVIFICLAIEVTVGAGGAPNGMPGTAGGTEDDEFMRFELIRVEFAICELKYC